MGEKNVSATQPASVELAQKIAASVARYATDVVISPGSRNSPLTMALLVRDDIRVHTRIDERSAAFLALGLARASKRPVAMVTTSGTAAVNCAPALVEAAHAHVPLVVITADRPAHMVGTGASQTIDQVGLFEPAVSTLQVSSPEDISALETTIENSFAAHINVAFDTPLVGQSLPTQLDTEKKLWRAPWVDHGEVTIDLAKNTLVIAGDEAWEVEGLEDVPTLAEPTAPAPYHAVHPLAAGLFAQGEITTEGSSEYAEYIARTKPDQVIVVGHPTLHRPVLALMADPEITVITLSRTTQVTDPTGNSSQVATRVKTTGEPTQSWLRLCQTLSEQAAASVREELPSHGFTGLHVAAALADGLGVGDTMFIGASNPVRDAAYVGLPFGGVETYSPRGTAGIDGSVSQAIGIALAVQARNPEEIRAPRTVALMGDVTFLHDVGGLLLGPDEIEPENLTIVVANDSGGGIFETLEVGAQPLRATFEKAVGTPHEVDIEALVQAYGHEYVRADSLHELLVALEDSIEQPHGLRIIDAHTVRDTRRELHRAMANRLGL